MGPFKHILVPTDFEAATSSHVLDVAVGLANALHARLTLLHVWEMPVYPHVNLSLDSDPVALAQESANTRLATALRHVRERLPVANSLLKVGTPWDGILEAVADTGADLVVMGTHGRRGIRHLLLGSVAEQVVRLCPVSVLTVGQGKARWFPRERTGSRQTPPRNLE